MFFSKIKSHFKKISKKITSFSIGNKIKTLFSAHKVDEELFTKLEELLYEADIGVETAVSLTEKIRDRMKKNADSSVDDILNILRNDFENILLSSPKEHLAPQEKPHVILVVGVNGSGKTTSLAKLALHYKKQGKKVLIAAGDTYRAAAAEQLTHWASSLKIDIIRSQSNADPAAVAFDALVSAKAKDVDVVLIDTAGRLHTKEDLMRELEKIKNVCKKHMDNAPHETLLTLDATTGQNAVDQAKIFHQFTPITGLILTKFDGSSKGGVTIAIKKQLNLDVKWVGTGEQAEDFQPFDIEEFVKSLLSTE